MSDALEELEAMLPRLGPAVDRRRFGEGLSRLAGALADAPRQTARLAALTGVARETGFGDQAGWPEALVELDDAVMAVSDEMLRTDDADGLRRIHDGYEEMKRAMGRAETQLRRHWKMVVDRDFRPLATIGRLLTSIDSTADVGRRLVACGEAADRSTEGGVPAEALHDAVRDLKRARETLEAEWHSLTRDAEVDAFLDAIAGGRATLRLMTAAVREWLEAAGALDRFVVRVDI